MLLLRIRVKYQKGDKVRFLSHLDLGRNIRLALKKAKWPFAITKGYTPRIKVSFYAPLPVGTSGKEEYMDVILDNNKIADFIQNQSAGVLNGAVCHYDLLHILADTLSRVLPPGFSVKQVFHIPGKDKPFESQIQYSIYQAQIQEVEKEFLSSAVERFLSQEQVLFEIRRPRSTRVLDLRNFVEDIQIASNSDVVTIFMKIKHDNGRTVRPQWILDCMARFGVDIDTDEVIVDRIKICLNDAKKLSIPPQQ